MNNRELPSFMTGECRAVTLDEFHELPGFLRPAPKTAGWWGTAAKTTGQVANGAGVGVGIVDSVNVPKNMTQDIAGHRTGVDPNATGAGAADMVHFATTPARGALSALDNIGQVVPGWGQVVSPVAGAGNYVMQQLPYYTQKAVQGYSNISNKLGIPDVAGAADGAITNASRSAANTFRQMGNSKNSIVSGVGNFGHAMMGSYVAPNAVSPNSGVVGATATPPQGNVVQKTQQPIRGYRPPTPAKPPQAPAPVQTPQPPQAPAPRQPLRSMATPNNFNGSAFSSYIGTKPQSLVFPQTRPVSTRSTGAAPRSSYFR